MTSRSADEVKAEFIQSFPAKTGELACELSWSITHLHLKWKNYRALFGTSPERIDLLNHAAPGFFGQLDPIMRHDVVLAITRLMDPPRTGRHKNASLGGLIELLAPHVGAAELAGWQSELALERGSQAAASSAGSIRGPRGPSHGAELSPSAVARLQSCGRGGTARTYSRPVQFDRGEVPRLARLARVDHRRWGRAAHRLAGASPGAKEKQARKLATQTKTITGCLQKGHEPDEFSITGEDGKVWGLRSSVVKLDGHLGHKVTVSGLITHESKAGETKKGKTEGAPGNEESGDLRVASLKMVSKTCGK